MNKTLYIWAFSMRNEMKPHPLKVFKQTPTRLALLSVDKYTLLSAWQTQCDNLNIGHWQSIKRNGKQKNKPFRSDNMEPLNSKSCNAFVSKWRTAFLWKWLPYGFMHNARYFHRTENRSSKGWTFGGGQMDGIPWPFSFEHSINNLQCWTFSKLKHAAASKQHSGKAIVIMLVAQNKVTKYFEILIFISL